MVSRLQSLVPLALAARGVFASIGPVTDLNIVSAILNPDGSVERGAVTAEGGAVGPLIVGNKGDNFQINVVNSLSNSTMLLTTSIHWHGIFQAGTNWADGPEGVNQCPIASGNSFLYNFNVPDQAGTFWYHSHDGTQYCDGLRGPLVVYDPSDPYLDDYDVDDESTVITLSDWYHDVAPTIAFGTSDATLINGLGRFFDGTNVNDADLAVISVEQGKRYRFRLISISCDPNFTFQIDQHNFTIIEVDGVNHEKLTVDSLVIFAGQRYSIILNADQPVDNYWIRADPNNGNTGTDLGLNSAILRYVGANETEPTTTQDTSANPLVQGDLVPLENPGVSGGDDTKCVDCADYNLHLDFTFNGTFYTNGFTWTSPTSPVLLQILSGATSASDLLPAGSLYALPANSSIQLSMAAGALAGNPHPFHLHGHTFDVVRGAGETTYNWDNPPRRDVVSLGDDATDGITNNVTVRFTTDNAGPWFLHCHIDWHLGTGLAIVFVEDFADISTTESPSTAWSDLCPTYDSLTADQLGGIN
ncbi:laccase [Punctularia strigosozonata HHB-11173 SS5]|uniref:laccase n=1 Tax=Punctularia strigosozonata (strain HHB-11173) TaxID=741275 RepID=UPI0004416457|nr:laccase [Punctularia strigosozonata HHB-11173 SS5]EIN05424.1 laccase [Punctularia strigosozonata HHB-11173 SS5]